MGTKIPPPPKKKKKKKKKKEENPSATTVYINSMIQFYIQFIACFGLFGDKKETYAVVRTQSKMGRQFDRDKRDPLLGGISHVRKKSGRLTKTWFDSISIIISRIAVTLARKSHVRSDIRKTVWDVDISWQLRGLRCNYGMFVALCIRDVCGTDHRVNPA